MSSSIPITPTQRNRYSRGAFLFNADVPQFPVPVKHHPHLINNNSMSHLSPCPWFPHQSVNFTPDSQVKLSHQPDLRRLPRIPQQSGFQQHKQWFLTGPGNNHTCSSVHKSTTERHVFLVCCPHPRELETSLALKSLPYGGQVPKEGSRVRSAKKRLVTFPNKYNPKSKRPGSFAQELKRVFVSLVIKFAGALKVNVKQNI